MTLGTRSFVIAMGLIAGGCASGPPFIVICPGNGSGNCFAGGSRIAIR
jgi:hypothetical protein